MSGPVNGRGSEPAAAAADQQLELKIVYNPVTGETNISGPLVRRDLCYAMLGAAQEILFRQAAQGQLRESRIVQPRIGIPR